MEKTNIFTITEVIYSYLKKRYNLGLKFLRHLNELIIQETLGDQTQKAAIALRNAEKAKHLAKH